ncbi:MAG: hypothetical protein QOF14_5023 [Hyphomicrobiales bacterium]|jgi:PAS domain S-box-containing protein|nr:hypothetical protein [Hyphomicrobiales bacterium]
MSISSQKPSRKLKTSTGDPARIEERYGLAMQSINYAVYDADLEGGEVYFSESLRKMLGMKPDDPAYRTGNIIETIHPDDRPAYREAIVEHFRGDTPRFEVDFRYKSADGSWRWCRQYGVAVRHPDGRAYRIVGAMSDVNEEHQRGRELETARAVAAAAYRQGESSTDRLTANEERYALAMESVNYGLYDWDIETDTTYYAPNLRILLGLAALNKPEDWSNRIHPSDLPIFRRRMIEHLKGETQRFLCDVRYRTEDGTWRWARQHGIAFRGPDGRAKRLVGAAGDITELKQREYELHSATIAAKRHLPAAVVDLGDDESRYALAIESISVGAGAYDVNVEAGMVYLAPTLSEVLGVPGHVSVSEFAAVVHPDDRPLHAAMVSALYRGDIPRLDFEFRYRHRDGTWRWARQHGIVVRDAKGRARRMVGVTGDITETRQRERQLDTAKAEAAAAQRDVESTREMLQTIIDNMTDGVSLFDKDMRWRFSNQSHMRTMGYAPETLRPGTPVEELIRLHATRGEYGPPDDVEALVKHSLARIRTPGGTRYERRMQNGKFIEFTFKPLSDGGVLGVYRDITELKEREEALAAAKEAAEAARDAAERARVEAAAAQSEIDRTREMMQTVLDNMSDGVMLFDKEMRWQFVNRQLMDFQRFPPDVAGPGVSAFDILRFQARRGDFGAIPDAEIDAEARRRVDIMRAGAHYERRTASGKFIEFTFKPLEDGGLLALYRDITELKEREEALAASKEAAEVSRAEAEKAGAVLQTVLDNMSDGVMLLDRDLNIRFANQRLMEFQRYSPEVAHPGSSIAQVLRYQARRGDFGQAGDLDRMVEERLALIRAPGGVHYERRSASGRYLEILFRQLSDGSVLAVNRDITELKEREEALAAAKEAAEAARDDVERTRQIMQTVLDNMIGGVMLFDKNFRLQFVNRQLMEFQQYPPDIIKPGITGEDILRFQVSRGDFGPVKDVEKKVRERVALIRRPGGNRFLRRTLENRFIEFNFLPLDDGGLLAFGRDVTSLKEREEALASAKEAAEKARDDVERTREVMQTVLDNMSDGVTLWDKNFRWQFSNRFSADMWNYNNVQTHSGMSGFDLIRQLAQQGEFGASDDVERTVTDVTRRILRPGGARYEQRTASGKFIEFNFRPLSDGGVLGLYRDITTLKSREEALASAKETAEAARDAAEKERAEAEAANQAKSTFLATMSHEIRTPMNGVLGMIDVLQRQGLDGPQRRTVSTIRDSAQSLLRIIDDVLDFSKIEAGRLELEETAFSLSGLIDGVASTFRQQAIIKGLALDVEIDAGSDDALVGDPTRVRQVLFNLLGNAIKFTERGRITLHAGTEPLGHGATKVTIAVSDTGIGLSPDQRARLFQPFAQADSSTTRRFGGTGLGLSIVRRLAQLMKGDIAVESRQGAGSTFTVTLTLMAAPADSPLNTTLRTAPRAPRSASARRSKSGARILIADDHPVNREVLVRQLELLGIASDTANDGVEALEAWAAADGHYTAVLADIHMPRMDGHELTRQIRAAEAKRGASATRTPIVAVTANAMKGEDERCLAAGMDAYLAKPVNMDQLRTTLERWMPIDDVARDASDSDDAPKPPSAIDRNVLSAWLGDDDAAINSLLAKFRDTAVAAEREIGAASRAGDLPTLAAAAHKLKGAAQTVGAAGVGTAAATLEQAGKGGDRIRCREGLGPLAAELRRALADIDRMNAAAK